MIVLLDNADRPNDRAGLRGAVERPSRWPPLMTIFLFIAQGLPPLAGFIAKWLVFSAAVKAGYSGWPFSAC